MPVPAPPVRQPAQQPAAAFFPCETKLCPHIHGNWSGYCAECSRKSWLPPGTLKRLKIAGRKARLLFITLVMSFLETEDKVLLTLFGGSIALVCFFYCLAEKQWAALVLVIAAFLSLALSIVGVPKKCRALSRRLFGKEIGFRGFVEEIEEVDGIAKKFKSTVADLVAGTSSSRTWRPSGRRTRTGLRAMMRTLKLMLAFMSTAGVTTMRGLR